MSGNTGLKNLLRLILHSLAYLLLLFFIFQACQIFYSALQRSFWHTAPDLSLQFLWLDRLAYFLSFGLAGGFLFLFILPRLLPAGNRLDPCPYSTIQQISLGGLVGLAMFAAIAIARILLPEQSPSPGSIKQARLLLDASYLIQHLLATGLITPVLEEFFYRMCMVGFLERFRLAESWNALLLKKHDPRRAGPGLMILFLPALAFALAHRQYQWLFLIWGLVFTLLYLRGGLLSSIAGHATYNSLLILASRWQVGLAST